VAAHISQDAPDADKNGAHAIPASEPVIFATYIDVIARPLANRHCTISVRVAQIVAQPA
jgi:hypothetical protein